jgi:hypothetical protein
MTLHRPSVMLFFVIKTDFRVCIISTCVTKCLYSFVLWPILMFFSDSSYGLVKYWTVSWSLLLIFFYLSMDW